MRMLEKTSGVDFTEIVIVFTVKFTCSLCVDEHISQLAVIKFRSYVSVHRFDVSVSEWAVI